MITYGLDKDGYPKPAAQRLEHWREKLGPRFFLFVGVMRYYRACISCWMRCRAPITRW